MRLFILISLSFLGITRCLSCIYQVRTRTVESGGSVTIPCSYAIPGEPDEDVRIIWGETSAESCLSDRKIFSHSGNVIEKYEGRLYREKDPNRTRTEYITITGLKPTDGPTFCCQLYNIKTNYSIQSNTRGTQLHFSDTEYVTQLDELMAVEGEEVIIPCYYSKDTKEITHVSWNFADRTTDRCIDTPILQSNQAQQSSLYFFFNYPQDISLRIPNTHRNDHRSFCCAVSAAQRTVLSKQFTRLITTEYQSSWDQLTNEISVQEGHSYLTLTCSYTLPGGQYRERDIVRVSVYWRVGNVTGPYAYHPYQEMVHSTYRYRTSITGMTNLMINDVKKADNTSFHCFVVVKLCAGEDKIQYGGGTRVIVTEHGTNNGNGSDMIIIAVCSVTILIILLVILFVLKVKGVIFKKNKHCSEQQMNTIPVAGDVTREEAQYSEINTKKPEDIPVNGTDETGSNQIECGQIEDGEDGNVFYAKLNKTKLTEKHPAENPKQNEEVVYAAVVKTT